MIHVALNRGEQLARRYWQKLFKEYCICDLSRYKENKACSCEFCLNEVQIFTVGTEYKVAFCLGFKPTGYFMFGFK